MNVLCVNHTGAVSGAERSLLDLLTGLRKDINVRLACPPTGPLAGAARELGVPVDEIPGVDGSLRLHPRETPHAVGRLSVAAVRTARHARRMRAHVIHANSIRSGLLTVPAARLTSVPAVVHLRDRLPRSMVADASLRLIASGAQVVAANSQYTAEGLRLVTGHGRLTVVYNPVNLEQFDYAAVNRTATRARLGLAHKAFVMAVVGQITPWKGQQEAVQILANLRRMARDVQLLIVGEPKFVSAATRYDNRAYYAMLEQTIRAEGVEDSVHLLGERADVPAIMGALDVLLVPSWEEPFGRVVVEAMALGLSVVATSVGGPAEIIHDGIDGILLAPRKPQVWTSATARLADSPQLRRRLGDAAICRAQDFALPRHVSAVRKIYEEAALTRSSRRASPR
jgi:glycosyltransferase involved in cell wall biosynthesis